MKIKPKFIQDNVKLIHSRSQPQAVEDEIVEEDNDNVGLSLPAGKIFDEFKERLECLQK